MCSYSKLRLFTKSSKSSRYIDKDPPYFIVEQVRLADKIYRSSDEICIELTLLAPQIGHLDTSFTSGLINDAHQKHKLHNRK